MTDSRRLWPLRRGFSLVEALICVTIIAILAALAIPVYRNVLGKQRAAACMGNLRQIGVAFATYLADHAGQLPAIGLPNSSAKDAPEWFKSDWFLYLEGNIPFKDYPFEKKGMPGGVAPYNSSLLFCPAADTSGFIKPYGVNFWLWQAQYANPIRILGLPNPSQTMLAADKDGSQSFISAPNRTSNQADARMTGRHAGFANTLYCDGHVEAILYDDFAADLKPVSDPFWSWGAVARP